MTGPSPSGLSPDEWLATRARHLSEAYDLTFEDCRENLLKQEAVLQRSSEHDEVVLWFEHDLFCQINLIYLLDWFPNRSARNTKLSLICIGEFPGIEDFRWLGQLTGEQLASLFDGRRRVTEEEFGLATQAWTAYCSSDPRDIKHLIEADTSALPFLREALLLHLARFPSVVNGLGRIENTALELISRGAIAFKELFPAFGRREPVYGLGDAQFWNEVKRLAEAKNPLIKISRQDTQSSLTHQALFELTAKGGEVLRGTSDFVELNGIDLWLGGVHLDDAVSWRWDEHNKELTRNRSDKKG